jgi:hypothetical protein
MWIADLDQLMMLGPVVMRWHSTFRGFSNCIGDQKPSLATISFLNVMAPAKSCAATSMMVAPNLRIMLRRSDDALLGITIVHFRLRLELKAANEIPVLPLVASTMEIPFLSVPRFNASSTMYRIGLSLMEPVGLPSSILAQTLSPTLTKAEFDAEALTIHALGILIHISSSFQIIAMLKGFGIVGFLNKGMLASAGVLEPFLTLQGPHARTRFSHLCSPPLDFGIT